MPTASRARNRVSPPTPDEAAAAAAALGFPVALKIRSPDIVHKSDVGGIALGLGDTGAVRDAAAAMLARIGAAMPQARIDGFLVQQMVASRQCASSCSPASPTIRSSGR